MKIVSVMKTMKVIMKMIPAPSSRNTFVKRHCRQKMGSKLFQNFHTNVRSQEVKYTVQPPTTTNSNSSSSSSSSSSSTTTLTTYNNSTEPTSPPAPVRPHRPCRKIKGKGTVPAMINHKDSNTTVTACQLSYPDSNNDDHHHTSRKE